MREFILLGATGSIGTQALEIVKNNDIKIRAIAIGDNVSKALEIIKEFNIEACCTKTLEGAQAINDRFPYVKTTYGENGLKEIIHSFPGDVINAIAGIDGLIPTYEALVCKKNVLLANKESMVVAGDIINRLAWKNGVSIMPIDSEHNAIYRLLKNKEPREIKKVIITASGGAFRDLTRDELADVTIDKALNHPNWNMGKLVTINCASMVNKGLEVIEAHHLFNIDYDKIETVMHKESIIHSFVELKDNSMEAVMYNPSMLVPISYCLLNKFDKTTVDEIDFKKLNSLTFEELSTERFPMLELAYKVGKLGGLYPAVYNSSNEVAVNLFLQGKIKFLEIEKIITEEVEKFSRDWYEYSIDGILKVDKAIKDKYKERYF